MASTVVGVAVRGILKLARDLGGRLPAVMVASVAVALAAPRVAGDPARILFVAGPDSHGWGEHCHADGARALAAALNASGLPVEADVHVGGWPEDPETLHDLAALVLYADGEDKHPLNGRADDLRGVLESGAAFVCLHYALDLDPGPLRALYLERLGGFFEAGWSVNPVWTPSDIRLAEHPATRGVDPFETRDEWYFHLRFSENLDGITPLLTAVPPPHTVGDGDTPRGGNPGARAAVAEQRPQILAWAFEGNPGARGFGFTGGHVRANWLEPGFRTLVLNGIAWAAGLRVPETGVPSDTPLIVRHETLLKAVARGDAEDAERHIRLGAEVNEANRSGWTPLHYAVLRNRLEAARVLLEAGANPDAVTGRGSGCLSMCAQRNYLEAARLLLEHDADLSARDQDGWTPLHHAAAHDRLDMARLFIEHGADVNAVSTLGGTPLHEAAASAGAELIRLLIEHGARRETRAQNGKTALDYAVELENEEAAAVLREP